MALEFIICLRATVLFSPPVAVTPAAVNKDEHDYLCRSSLLAAMML